MEHNFDQLVEEHFARKKIFDLDRLINLIEESLDARLLLEDTAQQLGFPWAAQEEEIDLTWSMIPEIAVSEIGWSTLVSDKKGGKKLKPSVQRQQLIQFLQNIAAGEDIQRKIQELNKFYHADPQELLKSGFFGDSTASQISKSLSYLIFFKTLTTIITHFNASSAGFSFESFLAVLLGGEQVPTGSETIADLTDAEGNPISLKLYTEGQLEVGGSYTDLVKDLHRLGVMQYINVTKTLRRPEGRDQLATEGTLRFMRFNFDLENVFNILSKSSRKSKRCILLPLPFIENPRIAAADLDAQIPAKEYFPSAQEMESEYAEILQQILIDETPAISKELGEDVTFVEDSDMERILQPLGQGLTDVLKSPYVAGKDPMSARKVAKQLLKMFNLTSRQLQGTVLVGAILAANEELRKRHQKDERAQARQSVINELYFYGGLTDDELVERSRAAYDELPKTLKKRALFVSRGFVDTGHFNLTQKMVEDIVELAQPKPGKLFPDGQETVEIGEIEFGIENVMKVVGGIREVLNASVFEIFANMKELSINLQSYFAEGLEDDDKADKAIESAQNIESKTEEVKKISPN